MDDILAKSPSYGCTTHKNQTNLSIVTGNLKQTNFGIHDSEEDVFVEDLDTHDNINTTLKALKDFRSPSGRPMRPSSANIQKARFHVRHNALNAANNESNDNCQKFMNDGMRKTSSQVIIEEPRIQDNLQIPPTKVAGSECKSVHFGETDVNQTNDDYKPVVKKPILKQRPISAQVRPPRPMNAGNAYRSTRNHDITIGQFTIKEEGQDGKGLERQVSNQPSDWTGHGLQIVTSGQDLAAFTKTKGMTTNASQKTMRFSIDSNLQQQASTKSLQSLVMKIEAKNDYIDPVRTQMMLLEEQTAKLKKLAAKRPGQPKKQNLSKHSIDIQPVPAEEVLQEMIVSPMSDRIRERPLTAQAQALSYYNHRKASAAAMFKSNKKVLADSKPKPIKKRASSTAKLETNDVKLFRYQVNDLKSPLFELGQGLNHVASPKNSTQILSMKENLAISPESKERPPFDWQGPPEIVTPAQYAFLTRAFNHMHKAKQPNCSDYGRTWQARPNVQEQEEERKRMRKVVVKQQKNEEKYSAYLNSVSQLNQKKAFLSTFRETLPIDEKRRLIAEITREQTEVQQCEKMLFKRKERIMELEKEAQQNATSDLVFVNIQK